MTFGGAENAASALATLTNTTAENALKSALEGLATIGAGNIARSFEVVFPPNFSFLISFGGTLAGPQSLITLSNNSLTGGASPTVTISLATIGVDPAGKAADSQPLLGPDFNGSPTNKTGLFALDKANLFNLLCIPPDTRDGDTPVTVYQKGMTTAQPGAMLIVDPPCIGRQPRHGRGSSDRGPARFGTKWSGRRATRRCFSRESKSPIQCVMGRLTLFVRVGHCRHLRAH